MYTRSTRCTVRCEFVRPNLHPFHLSNFVAPQPRRTQKTPRNVVMWSPSIGRNFSSTRNWSPEFDPGVFYRNWTVDNAKKLGLKGWVRNQRDGFVEALFSGSLDAVKEMQQQQAGVSGGQELGPDGKSISKRNFTMDTALEDKICDLYDLFVDGLDETAGPLIRKLYAEVDFIF